jgi:6-hydroxycyclohex-1-ene-1-carbonyl-CoA dehydrogenase
VSTAASRDAAAGQVEIAVEARQTSRAAGVGRVVSAGEHAAGLVGRRVLVGPIDPCGECDVCRRGGAAVCPLAVRRDALDARATAAGRWVVPLGDGLELAGPAAAAVAGDVALAYTLYARTGLGPRDPVVVVGGSPIARFLVEILLAKGIAPTAVAEPGAWADWLDGKTVVVARDRAGLTAAFAAKSLGTKPWRVICCDPDAGDAAAALAGPRATLTLLAGHGSWGATVRAVTGEVLAREVTIIGVAGAHPDLVVEAAAMCAKAEIDLAGGTTRDPADRLRTHVVSDAPVGA